MLDQLTQRFRRLHMIGILGSGMSGLAEILTLSGFQITGSDIADNEASERLKRLGVQIYRGHNAKYVESADVVVYSNAIRDNNPELMAARAKRIPVIPRAEMLAEICRMKACIAIGGTHGKTTTTSLVGEALAAGGLDPTVIVGGRLRQLGGGVISGKGDIIVVEADEYERSFLQLTPSMAIVTTIDDDHRESYGSFEALKGAFIQFGNSVPFYGRTIIGIDDPVIADSLDEFSRTTVTYGFAPGADVKVIDAHYDQTSTRFDIEYHGELLGEVILKIPGRHNALNAAAAIAAGLELGVDFARLAEGVGKFEGIHRRFEIYGEVGGALVVDDFAHHPTEISATIAAAKSGWGRRVIALFQPHLFSRTRELADKFGESLLGADVAFVLPIYPAREEPLPGVSSELIVNAARKYGHKAIHLADDRREIVRLLEPFIRPGDIILVMGAGDVYKVVPMIMEGFKQ